MRPTRKLLALALTAAMQAAVAAPAPVQLTFEDITATSGPLGIGMVQLLDRYQTNGVRFTGAAWGVASSFNNCGGLVLFTPLGGGCGALLLANDPTGSAAGGGTSFTLNFAEGFIAAGSSLFYSALNGSGVSISVFDELNGQGNGRALSSAGFAVQNCGTTGIRFCNWAGLDFDFSGTARSMVVTGIDQSVMLDNLTLVKASTVPGLLPEPASAALVLCALGAAGWSRKRKAA